MASAIIDRALGLSSSVAVKVPCRVATSTNITLSGEQTIIDPAGNYVAVVEGDRVLVNSQTSDPTNGIYIVSTGAWQRPSDFSRNEDVRNGTLVAVSDGASTTSYLYTLAIEDDFEFGVSDINFNGVVLDATETGQPRTVKVILSADWQAVPETPAQVVIERAMMDDIERYHSDALFGIIGGDLVDRPTDAAGALSPRTYTHLLADMADHIPSIPRGRWMLYAGNHDRDETGVGTYRGAWTYDSYKNYIGPLFYYCDYGNIRFIFLGDMAGSSSGEIHTFAYEWLAQVLRRSQGRNVIIGIHQPPDPTVYPFSADPLSEAFQRDPTRLTDLVSAYDNIAFVMHGHYGGTVARTTNVATAYGTTWVNCQMGIPTVVYNNGHDAIYSLAYFIEGESEIEIRRWSATDHDWLGINDVTVTTKYPLRLGEGDAFDFNGQIERDPIAPTIEGPQTVWASLAELRAASTPWAVDTTSPYWLYNGIVPDDASDDTPLGTKIGHRIRVPGSTSTTDANGNAVSSTPGYGGGAGWFMWKTVEGDSDYTSAFGVSVSIADGTEEIAARFAASTSPTAGLGLYFANSVSNVGGLLATADRTWFRYGTSSTRGITGGEGSPEGVISAPVGSGWFSSTLGILFTKMSGTGNTGWRAAPVVIDASGLAVSVGAVTTKETLVSVSIPAGAMGASGWTRVNDQWTMTNGADDKTVTTEFGAFVARSLLSTTIASLSLETNIANRDVTNAQRGQPAATAVTSYGSSSASSGSGTVDTTAAVTLLLTGQKETAGDTLTLERWSVIVQYVD